MNVRAGSLLAHPAAVAGGRLSAAPRHRVHPVGPVAGLVYGPDPVDVPDAPARLVSVRAGTVATCCSRGPGVAPRPPPGGAPCGDWHSRWPEASMTAWQLALSKESRPLAPATSLCRGSPRDVDGGGDLRRSWQGGHAGSGGASSRPGWPLAGEPWLRLRGLPHPAESG